MRMRSRGLRFLRVLLAASVVVSTTGMAGLADAAELVPLTELVSVTSDEAVASSDSYDPDVSDDGRYIVFATGASLDPADTDGGYTDIYRRDLLLGTTVLVSESPAGAMISSTDAYRPRLSDDGNLVLFTTALDLVPWDINSSHDLYVKDIAAGTYTFLDFWGDGSALGDVGTYALSGDGTTVVVDTAAALAAGDMGRRDIYAYDLSTGAVRWITEPPAGATETDRGSRDPSISDDGRYVVLVTGKDLDAADVNGDQDIYLYDMDLDITTVCDVRGDGSAASDEAWGPKISGDGSTIVFYSDFAFVNEDAGHQADVYSYVPATGVTTWLTKFSSWTEEWDRGARSPAVSDDGRWVVCFTGKDLAPEDDGLTLDLYLIDTASLLQTRLDARGDGSSLSSDLRGVEISGDGSTMAFHSTDEVVPADMNGRYDIYALVNPFTVGADLYTAQRNNALVVPAASGVLANDSARSGLPLEITGPTTAANGTVDILPDGSFTYTPDTGFQGTDSFMYDFTDGTSYGTGVATIQVVNTAPVAVDDSYSVQQDGYLYVPPAGLAANDTDANADTLTASKLTNPANGTVTVSPDGSFTYAPASGYVGTDSFTYKVNDGQADSPAATVTITVNAGGSGPVSELGAVFRFYNRLTGTHFYTYSTQERDSVLQNLRGTLIYEGVAFYANPASDTAPLYRFYNRLTNSHFYTASAEEKARVQATLSGVFTYEGVGFNVSMEPGPGKVAVYRFFNVRRGSHFYTASAAERDSVIAKWPTIYRYEGVAFYVTPASAGPN